MASLLEDQPALVTSFPGKQSAFANPIRLDIAGHVSKRMLKHYSHIRMEAKRTALESIVKKSAGKDASVQQNGQAAGVQQGPRWVGRTEPLNQRPATAPRNLRIRSAQKQRNSITRNYQ
jgi:hypothetical protein